MKGILIWVSLVLAVSTAWGYDQPDNLGGQKITPIKGMIIGNRSRVIVGQIWDCPPHRNFF